MQLLLLHYIYGCFTATIKCIDASTSTSKGKELTAADLDKDQKRDKEDEKRL